jgi:hypothetical protein
MQNGLPRTKNYVNPGLAVEKQNSPQKYKILNETNVLKGPRIVKPPF